MKNLWPDEMLDEHEKQVDGEIERVLEAQAEGILERTDGLVAGFIQDRSTAPAKAWSLELYSAHQSARMTPILIVRSAADSFPAVIESFDPNQVDRYRRVDDLLSFQTVLKELLNASQTKNIVKLLAQEAISAGVKGRERTPQEPAPLERTLLVGGVTKTDLRDFCHVVLLDVAGFVDAKDMQNLLMAPDALGSPILRNNGRFVVTVKFLDTVKFTLNGDELETLQAEVKKALGII